MNLIGVDMEELQVGDKVKVVLRNSRIECGQLGKVLEVIQSGKMVSVEFQKFIQGHNSHGLGKEGHCWCIRTECLTKVTSIKRNLL